ncbi:DinB family protein [Sphingobacterium paludis]|uniref:DinB family protein n=1 Tax=Sphingobacterium paludis TaxID=1476465 RepID=UPI0010620D04|nr:DinB family protein [Sphingobacterium paludis]
MNIKASLVNYVDYNIWVTTQLVDWLWEQSDEMLYEECRSSFTSIARTLKHISDTQLYWSSMIRESPTPNFDYNPMEVDVRSEMDKLLNEAKLLADYVKDNGDDMCKRYLIDSEWFSSNFPKYEYLFHLILHTTYHRGQIVTIAHNVGIPNPPMLDYNFWNVLHRQTK